MGGRRLLAADGGNSKTDLILLDSDGQVLAAVRGPGSNPDNVGVDGCLAVLERLVAEAARIAGDEPVEAPLAEVGAFYLAGIDLPAQQRRLGALVDERGWSARTVVDNDAFAVLRAGTPRAWGVAVVCGAGVNCVAVAPDGRRARYQAFGPVSGDWGGGLDVGLAALAAAVRGRDGRGPRTSLERSVPAHLGLPRPQAAAEAIHTGRLPMSVLTGLAPLVLAAARAGDQVAGAIVDRLGDELATMIIALIRRLRLVKRQVDVVLGGGLLQAGDARLLDRVRAGVLATATRASLIPLTLPPVTGAALLALEAAGADQGVLDAARRGVPVGMAGALRGRGER
jgi:N-acetylglucosamine kinase-like BadF-type ATPase